MQHIDVHCSFAAAAAAATVAFGLLMPQAI